ncbi:hypothetical protein [Nonomuraea indica]|uniref:hypothetical protein n=1 Tax=Nonomuraea indica TaxID=1581193 RepID=UPI000C7CC557|nr:hypothetical protein [Nonomuraea indica]
MVVIGFTLLGVGLVVGLLLALADPVLLSRINGEPAEGASGRRIDAPRVRAPREAAVADAVAGAGGSTARSAASGAVVRLADRVRDERPAPRAA